MNLPSALLRTALVALAIWLVYMTWKGDFSPWWFRLVIVLWALTVIWQCVSPEPKVVSLRQILEARAAAGDVEAAQALEEADRPIGSPNLASRGEDKVEKL